MGIYRFINQRITPVTKITIITFSKGIAFIFLIITKLTIQSSFFYLIKILQYYLFLLHHSHIYQEQFSIKVSLKHALSIHYLNLFFSF